MAHSPKTPDLLKIALGDGSTEGLKQAEASTVDMIRSVVQTIHLDHLDPVPTAVIQRGKNLAGELGRLPSWFDRALAIVMTPLFDDRPQLALGLRGGELRQCTFGVDGHRLDLEVELLEDDDPTSNKPTRIQGQIDGEAPLTDPIEVAVLFAGTDHVAATAITRTDGRFNLVLDQGEYEFAFRLVERTLTIGRIEIP
jgi:hypothetical protein